MTPDNTIRPIPETVGLPQIYIHGTEDEMVTLHREKKYVETLFMSCPEQARDFAERHKHTVIYSLDGWCVLREAFQKTWQSKYPDEY